MAGDSGKPFDNWMLVLSDKIIVAAIERITA